ncbi:hypothetical protein RI662_10535 [Brevibacillus agri]|uniref:hypothetical protein n=1 Tax=Brevibacillus agri TaxID=51101 RepID=UPI0012FD0E4B|nr:hypothetical protein [Brevibacillus agri]MDR9504726.1 hypothetical protein [Brevibacillus agri]
MEYHVYECQDCCLGFAVEATADQSHIVCPDCQSDNLRDVGTGTMVITSIAIEKDPALER